MVGAQDAMSRDVENEVAFELAAHDQFAVGVEAERLEDTVRTGQRGDGRRLLGECPRRFKPSSWSSGATPACAVPGRGSSGLTIGSATTAIDPAAGPARR